MRVIVSRNTSIIAQWHQFNISEVNGKGTHIQLREWSCLIEVTRLELKKELLTCGETNAMIVSISFIDATTTPNYKTIFFAKQGSRTHGYMFEPMSLLAIWILAFMRLGSNACETEHWGTSDESGWLCILCPNQVRDFKYHALIQCFAFPTKFYTPSMIQTQYLHEFLSQP